MLRLLFKRYLFLWCRLRVCTSIVGVLGCMSLHWLFLLETNGTYQLAGHRFPRHFVVAVAHLNTGTGCGAGFDGGIAAISNKGKQHQGNYTY